MNDLREVLTRHADSVTAADTDARIAGVRQHIRAERRRRTTVSGVVGGLAVAAIALGTINLQGVSQPKVAGRPEVLAGHTVPGAKESLGYGFKYVAGREAKSSLKWQINASKKARLVSFASAAEGEVTVEGLSDLPMHLNAGDFGTQWLIQPGHSVDLKVRGDGDVAVAVFDNTTAAPGVSKDGITYRSAIANGANLVTAQIGDPGENRLEGAVDHITMSSSFTGECIGPRDDLWVRVTVNGKLTGSSTCNSADDAGWDPGVNGGGFFPNRNQSGPVKVVTELVDKAGNTVEDPNTRIMFAAYDNTDVGFPRTAVEFAGNVWRLGEELTSAPGRRSFKSWIDTRKPVYVWAESQNAGDKATLTVSSDIGTLTVPGGGGGSLFLTGGTAKTPVRMRLSGPISPSVVMKLRVFLLDQ